MNILIKFATRGRKEAFTECIKNIQRTISGKYKYEVHVTVDDDDESMFKKEQYENVTYWGGMSLSKVYAINRDMDIITKHFNWDILINFSDDMLFVKEGWDEIIVEDFKKSGTDAFHHYNDGYVKDALPTMSVMDREYYERFFYIYPHCYYSFSCDAEAMFVAQMLGKWHYHPEVIVNHNHPANNRKAKTDNTYMLANERGLNDTKTYFDRLKNWFYVNNPKFIPDLMKPHLRRLAIMIPTTYDREPLLQRLLDVLNPQVLKHKDDVCILIECDEGEKNGGMTTGAKRNMLVQKAISLGFTYGAFFDSDDLPSEDYIDKQLSVVQSGADCGSLLGSIYFSGAKGKPFHHSIKYKVWGETPVLYERCPNHLNCVKLKHFAAIPFPDKTFGEDGVQSEAMAKSGVLKTEHLIDSVIYHYFTGAKDTQTERDHYAFLKSKL